MSKRLLAVLAVLGLVLAACSTAGDSDAATDSTTTVSTPASTTSTESQAPTTDSTSPPSTIEPGESSEGRPAPDPNRSPAPDFTLELGTGGTYQLSAETKPVYMVFWAEW